ncbi:hypothetical protein BCR39DRAFT_542224 [Naematelia encephala]|uniref:FAD-binding domain-containing protein n=1 Tax=Naematelia encephala TaxID=71784 RepID=A0A1Y2AUY1_9TREE|nr:hypothetical protein BCR39DRAFT_542224 [Naematelia encephala]
MQRISYLIQLMLTPHMALSTTLLSMAPLNVLIVGGGIAGNALAFWLSKLNHKVTVVERFPTLRDTGLQIDLRGHGVQVMKRMGLEDKYRGKLAPEQGVRVVGSSGRQWAFFPAKTSSSGIQSFSTEWEIMRGDLTKLLAEACDGRVEYLFGSSVKDYSEHDKGVHVTFENGTTGDFDFLVGADGVGSRTRRTILEPGQPDPLHPLDNLHVAYFTLPRPIQKDEKYVATVYMGTNGRGIMTRRQNPDSLQVYVGGRTDSGPLTTVKRGDVPAEKKALGDFMRGGGWITDEIVEAFDQADDFYLERLSVVKMDKWSKGRVVLLGDAAYCPSATTGMGTTSSIVGAYVLAGEIAKQKPQPNDINALTRAFTEYENKFRPFMDDVTKGILESGGGFSMPTSRIGITMMNLMAGLVSFLKIDVTRWMVKEHVSGWDLPEYEELSDIVKSCRAQ